MKNSFSHNIQHSTVWFVNLTVCEHAQVYTMRYNTLQYIYHSKPNTCKRIILISEYGIKMLKTDQQEEQTLREFTFNPEKNNKLSLFTLCDPKNESKVTGMGMNV